MDSIGEVVGEEEEGADDDLSDNSSMTMGAAPVSNGRSLSSSPGVSTMAMGTSWGLRIVFKMNATSKENRMSRRLPVSHLHIVCGRLFLLRSLFDLYGFVGGFGRSLGRGLFLLGLLHLWFCRLKFFDIRMCV